MQTKDIVAAVRAVVGPGRVELHKPSIGVGERVAVEDCLRDGVVGYGYVDSFQAAIAQACGVEQALVTSSGTAALHLALLVTGVEPYTEVLVPALTFVATANAVSYCGAIPNFVDVMPWDYGISPFKLNRYLARICERRDGGTFNRMTGRKITALIAVDLLGIPARMDEINIEASRWGIPVIEDAAEALGSKYKGRPCGGSASIGVVSFNNNKIVTTNGGGALLTNDPFVQAKAWELATTARVGHPWMMGNHTCVAWNYRMGNINAALGLPQLQRLELLVEQKIKLHHAYAQRISGVKMEAQLDAQSRCNYWLNALTLDQLDHRRDEICAALTAEGIACRTIFTPLNDLPMYRQCPRDNLEMAQMIWRQTICLPSSPSLGERL